MKKIRIAHFVSALQGGVGNVILNYFGHMPDDYEVDIVSEDISSALYEKQYKALGFNVIQISSKKNLVYYYKEVSDLIKRRKYDVVHCHMTATNIIPLAVAKSCDVPVRISHAHLAGRDKLSLKDRVFVFLSHSLVGLLATERMACGKNAGKFLFGKKSFIVLNNALELSNYVFDENIRRKQRDELDMQNKTVIGHVGRFTLQKNHDFIIEAFAKYYKKDPESILLLIGSGELYEIIQEKIQKMGLQNAVICTGEINDVNSKMQAMDIFILPSLSEGLPVVALEAQATGLPCIISENVTKEVSISQNVSYLPITQPDDVEKWAAQMMQYRNVPRTEDTVLLLRKCGYDISVEGPKLDQFYKERIKK